MQDEEKKDKKEENNSNVKKLQEKLNLDFSPDNLKLRKHISEHNFYNDIPKKKK